jgi:hypothetical protein
LLAHSEESSTRDFDLRERETLPSFADAIRDACRILRVADDVGGSGDWLGDAENSQQSRLGSMRRDPPPSAYWKNGKRATP